MAWETSSPRSFPFNTTSNPTLHGIIFISLSAFGQDGFSSPCRRSFFALALLSGGFSTTCNLRPWGGVRHANCRRFASNACFRILISHEIRVIRSMRGMTGSLHIKILQKSIASIDKHIQKKTSKTKSHLFAHLNREMYYLPKLQQITLPRISRIQRPTPRPSMYLIPPTQPPLNRHPQ
jgi:hypothetical protein